MADNNSSGFSSSNGTKDLRFEYAWCKCGKKANLRIMDSDKPTKGMLYFTCDVCKYWSWCNTVSKGFKQAGVVMSATSSHYDGDIAVKDEIESKILNLEKKMSKVEKKFNVNLVEKETLRTMSIVTWVLFFIVLLAILFK